MKITEGEDMVGEWAEDLVSFSFEGWVRVVLIRVAVGAVVGE
jgi:hypothetical protein